MKLVDVLAGGVRGAEDGTVEIYRRGTSMFATVYTDYKGGGATTPTAGLSLDSNGGLEVYVDEEVDCVAKSSSGAVVRPFTVINTASSTEVKSQSFTGTDYDTALSAANYPLTLSSLLDLWKTNAGAVDWKVLIGGVGTTLQTAFSSVSGLFFNVKATAYGAKGDNTTDDTSAIQAAIDAANAFPGGTVFFPGGSYRITSALNLKDRVSILGAGSRAVSILIDHASNDAISVAAGVSDQPISIRGITVLPKQSNSGKMLKVEAGTPVNCYDCTFGGALLTGTSLSYANAATNIVCVGVTFETNSAAAVFVSGSTAFASFVGCRFVHSATNFTSNAVVCNGGAAILGCTFDFSAVSNAAANGSVLVFQTANTHNLVVGNRYVNPSTGTSIVAAVQVNPGPGSFLVGNALPANILPNAVNDTAAAATHEGSYSLDHDARRYFVTDNTAAINVSPEIYGTIEVRRTNNGNQTVVLGGPGRPGIRSLLVWNNDHAAGGGTITLTTVKGLANFTVNANSVSVYELCSYENVAAGGGAGTFYWGLFGSVVNVTP